MVLRKRIVCFVLTVCIALQPIGMHASQSFDLSSIIPSPRTSFSSLSLFNSDNWKKYGAALLAAAATAAGLYKVYWWWMTPKPAAKEIKPVNFDQPPAKLQPKPEPVQKENQRGTQGTVQPRKTIDLTSRRPVQENPHNPSMQTVPGKTAPVKVALIEDPVQKKINDYLVEWGCQNALRGEDNKAPAGLNPLFYAGQGALRLIEKSVFKLDDLLVSYQKKLLLPDEFEARNKIVKKLLEQAEDVFEKATRNSSYGFQLDNLSRETQRELLNISWKNIAIGDKGKFPKAYFWIARAKEVYSSAGDVYKFLKSWKGHSSLYKKDLGLEQAVEFVRLKADKDAREKLDVSVVSIKQYVIRYFDSNWDYMEKAFIDEPKTMFLFNMKDESESEALIKGLIAELRNKYASQGKTDNDFKKAIMDQFVGFDSEGREGLSTLIEKSIENMQNLPEKLQPQRLIEPVQQQEISQQREESLGVPVISQEKLLGVPQSKMASAAERQLEQAPNFEFTPEEKEYLKNNHVPTYELALTPASNVPFAQQDEILWSGGGALSIISPVLWSLNYESKDRKEFLKNLLGKAETVFSDYLSRSDTGYRSLKSNMDFAEEEKIKSLSWERPRKANGEYDFNQPSPLTTHFLKKKMNEDGSKVDRAKFTQVDFWIMKTAAIKGSSLWATSADTACKNLQTWQENTDAFKNDLAFKRAVKIACEAAEIERNSDLPKALEAK